MLTIRYIFITLSFFFNSIKSSIIISKRLSQLECLLNNVCQNLLTNFFKLFHNCKMENELLKTENKKFENY